MRALAAAALAAVLVTTACIQDVTASGADSGGSSARDAREAAEAGPFADASDGGALVDAADAEPRDALPFRDGGEDAGADGGAPDATPPRPPLTWSEMVLPANTRFLEAVWGRSATEIYAASGSGFVYRSDGTSWTQVWRTPNNEAIHDMTGDADHLYVVGDSTAWAVDVASMTAVSAQRAQSRRMHAVAPLNGGPTMLLGLSEMVDGVLASWDATVITVLHRPLMVTAVFSVYPDATDLTYFGGTYGTINRLQRGAVTAETVLLPADFDLVQRAGMSVRGLGRVGPDLFAVGSQHLILRRNLPLGVPTWEVVYRGPSAQAYELRAIAGGSLLPSGDAPYEAYAVGEAPSTGGIVRFDGRSWVPQGVTDQWVLADIWRATPDLYFAVGFRRNGIDGVVLRGER